MKKMIAFALAMLLAMAFVSAFADFQLGSKGDAVAELQQRLIELGYLDGEADGIFGEKTETALIAFQTVNSLEPTGIAYLEDINLLYSDDVVPAPVEE